jgi:hypothetical protein
MTEESRYVQIFATQYTQKIAYNASGMAEYIGEAKPGTLSSAIGWRIKKLTYSGTNVTDIQWADGTGEFVKTWDLYLSYTYS